MIFRVFLFCTISLCLSASSFADAVETARRNGEQAREALVRSERVLHAYLQRLDRTTGLLPRTGKVSTWYVRDSAADLYPFLVMAAYYTDRSVFDTTMMEILRNEVRHSTRLGMLSDNVLAGGGFENQEVNLDSIMFGSCEYAKDGLLPLTELLGHHAWYERMCGIADDVIAHAPYDSSFGKLPSVSAEINGEFLQVLARLAFLTRDPRYVQQMISIGDFYFNEVIPKSNGIPAHLWDLKEGKPANNAFVFSDHGNEIAGGLSELVMFLKETGHPKFAEYKGPMTDLMDTLLQYGLNEDGVWYSKISITDRKILDARHAHCWGYLFNAVYTTYLITGEERFIEATQRAMRAVTEKPTYLDDPEGSGRKYGSNAYSDAIESAIVFLNRLPNEEMSEVLDVCVKRFLSRQREDGIIEDWYGDGNYVRTSLMYVFMKSQGTWIEPWREDTKLGAVRDGEKVTLTLDAEKPWQGKIRFDIPRHKMYFNLPVNYTRLNEFPEWFTVDLDHLYTVRIGDEEKTYLGGELRDGIAVSAGNEKATVIDVSPMEGPPYGTR
ncbi:MAG TPA: hypothetical protein PLY86_04635 [bacterium]|nr:hypothetical protein [bacterium]